MPAWSVPGKYSVLYPRMRCQRVRMSISVWSSMCPMCSDPVTFGGGMTIENTGPGAFASALNSSSFTQKSAHRGSICCGSYAFAISRAIRCTSPCKGAPWPALLCQFESSRVIFDYTRGKVAASIRPGSAPRENVHFNEHKTRMDLRSYGGSESRLLRFHLFLNHGRNDRLQDFSRDRLQNVGTQVREHFGNQVVHAALGRLRLCGFVSCVEAFTGGLFLRRERRAFGNLHGLLADGRNRGRWQVSFLDHFRSRLAGSLSGFFRSIVRRQRSGHRHRSIPRRSKPVRLLHLRIPRV